MKRHELDHAVFIILKIGDYQVIPDGKTYCS